ncbi:MAG: tRNA-dihydrouridine synthase [Kiritimatiellae bacterium]|nr:tRNA-dihydrouridine synthase [Kiritimatiellia bacterium]
MKLVLAPIAGFSNAAFRLMAARGGADLTYTEMVSAAGLAHGSSPTRHLMELLPGEGPVACQLFGSKTEELAFSVREVAALSRFSEINLNAGCPVPRIVKEGSGSALVKNPQLVHDLLHAMVSEAGDVPVTLKTRPGPRPDNVLMLELLDAAEKAGARGIILHSRFTSQNHGGDVHLDLLAELVAKSKIPVTGNGSVVDANTMRLMADTGVQAIMIGRAALSDPYIFNKLKGVAHDPLPAEELFRENLDALVELHAQIGKKFPSDRLPPLDFWVSSSVRTHLFRYFSGRPGAGEFRRRLMSLKTVHEILSAVELVSSVK